MWDERFSTEDYAYGKLPTAFSPSAMGPYLGTRPQPRGGEGRNAVFLARQGYAVTAVDGSAVGLAKARRLAEEGGVAIDTLHADLADFDLGKIAGKVSSRSSAPALDPAGRGPSPRRGGSQARRVFLLEAYRPEQVQYGTGGGKGHGYHADPRYPCAGSWQG